MNAFSLGQLNAWRQQLDLRAAVLAAGLLTETPVDLMASYAAPLCSGFAAIVTAIDPHDAVELSESAKLVSAAAADPYNECLRSAAKSANADLRRRFTSGPDLLRDSGFVALSATLPCILGNAWFALLQSPGQWSLLHRNPDLIDQAIEELLRYAGLVRVLFRVAVEDFALSGSELRKGQRVILRIFAANRDPERFADPNRLDITRRAAGQIALGAGQHSCVGANLIRTGAATMTQALVRRFESARLKRADWRGGAVFRSPACLWASLGVS